MVGLDAAAVGEPDAPERWQPGPQACSPEISQAGCTDPGSAPGSCTADAQCTDQAHGKCVQGFGMIGPYCQCAYACATDDDCGDGRRCVCADALRGHYEHSLCVEARCDSADDCASGECALSLFFNGCTHEAVFACRTAEDACASDSDCPGRTCAYEDSAGAWTCQVINCIFGRPLVIEGAPRVAGAASRSDWLIAGAAAGEGAADERARLGAYWTEVAALEHASVASFARFTLELLAFGAPPELVAEAQRAGLDEVRHAQLAWSLASAYLGRPVGPGPLRVDDVAPARSIAAMVDSLVREGCIGETLGAAEAERTAETAASPELRAALREVASDERRHAALAWRTLRWLVARDGEPVRRAALAAVGELDAEAAGLRGATLATVIRPLLSAIVGGAAG